MGKPLSVHRLPGRCPSFVVFHVELVGHQFRQRLDGPLRVVALCGHRNLIPCFQPQTQELEQALAVGPSAPRSRHRDRRLEASGRLRKPRARSDVQSVLVENGQFLLDLQFATSASLAALTQPLSRGILRCVLALSQARTSAGARRRRPRPRSLGPLEPTCALWRHAIDDAEHGEHECDSGREHEDDHCDKA